MKILLLMSDNFRTAQTGDATQGRMTVDTFRRMEHEVTVVFVNYFPLRFKNEDGISYSEEELIDLANKHNVVHLLPVNPILACVFNGRTKTPVLGSSIFWGGWERVCMAWKSAADIKSKIHDCLRMMTPMLHYKMDYRGIDVFLPNSNAEGKCLLKYFKKSKNATYFPVPNGFVAPSREKFRKLPRSQQIPKEDYIVVPGIFARRKNQLSLVKALRKLPYQIVFLGDRFKHHPEYIDRCKAFATDNMHFLGYIPSSSNEYWAILKYARCACLPSDCETPGIAMLEAAYAGCRPIITKYGGTNEYFGFDAEYLDPCSIVDIQRAVNNGWRRGRLTDSQADVYARFSWDYCAELTLQAYEYAIKKFDFRKVYCYD